MGLLVGGPRGVLADRMSSSKWGDHDVGPPDAAAKSRSGSAGGRMSRRGASRQSKASPQPRASAVASSQGASGRSAQDNPQRRGADSNTASSAQSRTPGQQRTRQHKTEMVGASSAKSPAVARDGSSGGHNTGTRGGVATGSGTHQAARWSLVMSTIPRLRLNPRLCAW